MLDTRCSMLVEDPVFSGDKNFLIYSDWKYYQFVVWSFSKDKKVIKFLISFPLKITPYGNKKMPYVDIYFVPYAIYCIKNQ